MLDWAFAKVGQLSNLLHIFGASDISIVGSLPEYVQPLPTSEKLEWADLPIIDLSTAATPIGRQALVKDVCQALKDHGFFYIINHGYTPTQTTKIFTMASATFDLVDDDEKKALEGRSVDVYEGYKPRSTWHIENGVSDQIEHYNINHDIRSQTYPSVIKPHIAEIEAFIRHNHINILHPILRILALGMGLPEETLVEQHRFEEKSHSSLRFMKYYPRTAEEEALTRNVWLKGHTDIGSVTILWSQPVSGLQVLSRDGKWKYVQHIDNALVINTGDVMQFLSGGFYTATIHRVIQPPKDQCHIARLGMFYFSMADDKVKLRAHRLGQAASDTEDTDNPEVDVTMEEWRKERTAKYGKTDLKKSETDMNVEEDRVCGVVVKEYN